MNSWEIHLEKKFDQRNRKNSKNQNEIGACEQKTIATKRIFHRTPFSHSTLQLHGLTKITTPI